MRRPINEKIISKTRIIIYQKELNVLRKPSLLERGSGFPTAVFILLLLTS
jgi:hypothetical protein